MVDEEKGSLRSSFVDRPGRGREQNSREGGGKLGSLIPGCLGREGVGLCFWGRGEGDRKGLNQPIKEERPNKGRWCVTASPLAAGTQKGGMDLEARDLGSGGHEIEKNT